MKILLTILAFCAVNTSADRLRCNYVPWDCVYVNGEIDMRYVDEFWPRMNCGPDREVKQFESYGITYGCCDKIETPTTTTTEEPTTTTTTAAPTTTTPCSISCSGGFRDLSGCHCCNFESYSIYADLSNQLDSIISRFDAIGRNDEYVEGKIAELDALLDEVYDFVISHCNEEVPKSITDRFGYISAELINLSDDVQLLTCDRKDACPIGAPERDYVDCSCFCSVSCDASAGYVQDSASCDCIYFEDYSRLIDRQTELEIAVDSLYHNFRNIPAIDQLRKDLYEEIAKINNLIYKFENKFESLPEDEWIHRIDTVIDSSQIAIENVENFKRTGPCNGKVCPKYNVPFTPTCACITSPQIKIFYDVMATCAEDQIMHFDYKNDEKAAYFKNWLMRVRTSASSFLSLVTTSVVTPRRQNELVIALKTDLTNLSNEFNAYVLALLANPNPECDLQGCIGDSVMDCTACECVEVLGWYELTSNVKTGVWSLKDDINSAVNINPANKAALISNINAIGSGISDVNSYAYNHCLDLDASYVQLKTLELLGQFDKADSDIHLLESHGNSNFCENSCPNYFWIYNANTCDCSCESYGCLDGAVFDSYNCMCVANENCNLSCDDSQILDSSRCSCKASP